jgi:hypothetical protein
MLLCITGLAKETNCHNRFRGTETDRDMLSLLGNGRTRPLLTAFRKKADLMLIFF